MSGVPHRVIAQAPSPSSFAELANKLLALRSEIDLILAEVANQAEQSSQAEALKELTPVPPGPMMYGMPGNEDWDELLRTVPSSRQETELCEELQNTEPSETATLEEDNDVHASPADMSAQLVGDEPAWIWSSMRITLRRLISRPTCWRQRLQPYPTHALPVVKGSRHREIKATELPLHTKGLERMLARCPRSGKTRSVTMSLSRSRGGRWRQIFPVRSSIAHKLSTRRLRRQPPRKSQSAPLP